MLHHLALTGYVWQPRPAPGWRFDLPSALIGAAVALLLAGLAYYFRDHLRLAWDALQSQALRLYQLAQAGVGERYCRAVAGLSRSPIAPSPPDQVFVTPCLAVPLPPPRSPEELDETLESVPESHRVVSLDDLRGEHDRLLIVGAEGAGRTALLTHLARACARPPEEQAAVPPLTQGRTPLYLPLTALAWDGDPAPEAEDLVRAAVAVAGGSNAATSFLQRRLADGQAAVLLDDWDALTPAEQEQVAARLREWPAAMPGNLWLVAVGERGYGPLVEADFVPLTLTPWDAHQVEELARRWGDTYRPDELEPPLDRRELTAALQARARRGDRPLELALGAFIYLTDRRIPAGRAPLFDRALEMLLGKVEPAWVPEVCKASLERLALRLLQEGRAVVGKEEIEAEVKSLLPATEDNPDRAAAAVLRVLTGERGLIHHLGGDRYAFAHHLWQSYLAARRLVAETDNPALSEHLDDRRWEEVLLFFAEMGDIGPLISRWLHLPDDIFLTRLRTLSRWIQVAPEKAAWKDGAMAVLARSFLAARHFPVRRRLAIALADTRASGIAYFFKQALQHGDAEVRAAAVAGFVRVMGEGDFPALEKLFRDVEPAVVEAAVRGLADVGTEAAVRLLERILFSGDETLAPLAAETLARCDGRCRSALEEAATAEDPLVRRAAIFGLVLIGGREPLERLAREDDQWIVRTGAQAALDELTALEQIPPVAPPPVVAELPWLISWAAARGESVGLGEAAHRVLHRALQEGQAAVRYLAARVLAQVGRAAAAAPLQDALDDEEPLVAETAWDALAAVARRYDLRVE